MYISIRYMVIIKKKENKQNLLKEKGPENKFLMLDN